MKWRLPQFSMRVLVIVMLLFGAGLGLIGRELFQIRTKAEKQREFVEQLKSKGVRLIEEDRKDLTILESLAVWIEGKSGLSIVSAVTLLRGGLPEEEVLSIAKLDGLKSVTDQGVSFSDKTLEVLGQNPTLQTVILYKGWQGTEAGANALVAGNAPLVSISLLSTPVDDEFLERASRSHSLENLMVNAERLSASGLSKLKESPGLTQVVLHNATNMGDGLRSLANHSKLRELGLYEYSFGAGEIETLSTADQLEGLVITTNRFPKGMLKSVSEMKHLKRLALRGEIDENEQPYPFQSTRLENLQIEGLPDSCGGIVKCLVNCKSLKYVWLTNVSLTDTELAPLAECKGLQSVTLGSGPTSEAVSRFQKSLPLCKVTLQQRDGRIFIYKPGGEFELRQPPPNLKELDSSLKSAMVTKP